MDTKEALDLAEQAADWLAGQITSGEPGCSCRDESGGKREDFITAIRAVVLALDSHEDASTPAFDEIAKLCGCKTWEYPGQVVRDVMLVVKQRDEARETVAGLMGYVNEAKIAGGNDIVAGEPLADFVKRITEERAEAVAIARKMIDDTGNAIVQAELELEVIVRERDTARALADVRAREIERLTAELDAALPDAKAHRERREALAAMPSWFEAALLEAQVGDAKGACERAPVDLDALRGRALDAEESGRVLGQIALYRNLTSKILALAFYNADVAVATAETIAKWLEERVSAASEAVRVQSRRGELGTSSGPSPRMRAVMALTPNPLTRSPTSRPARSGRLRKSACGAPAAV